jgi:predicted amidohydrolase YtcJ
MINSQDAEDLDEILQSDTFRQRGVIAFFADGAPDSKTAAFFEPYPDELTNYGMLYYHPNEHQRITFYEALQLFTVNGAKIGFEEHSKGRIEAGKLADFTVLSDDPYSVKRDKVGQIDVEMTIVGRKDVFSKPS